MRYDISTEEYIDIDVHACVYAGEVLAHLRQPSVLFVFLTMCECFQALFETDGDEGESSIAAAVLHSILHSPIDARCKLAQNIRNSWPRLHVFRFNVSGPSCHSGHRRHLSNPWLPTAAAERSQTVGRNGFFLPHTQGIDRPVPRHYPRLSPALPLLARRWVTLFPSARCKVADNVPYECSFVPRVHRAR